MAMHGRETDAAPRRDWLFLAGAGLAGVLAAVWWSGRRRSRGEAGLYAELVPPELARREAKWTREALKSK